MLVAVVMMLTHTAPPPWLLPKAKAPNHLNNNNTTHCGLDTSQLPAPECIPHLASEALFWGNNGG